MRSAASSGVRWVLSRRRCGYAARSRSPGSGGSRSGSVDSSVGLEVADVAVGPVDVALGPLLGQPVLGAIARESRVEVGGELDEGDLGAAVDVRRDELGHQQRVALELEPPDEREEQVGAVGGCLLDHASAPLAHQRHERGACRSRRPRAAARWSRGCGTAGSCCGPRPRARPSSCRRRAGRRRRAGAWAPSSPERGQHLHPIAVRVERVEAQVPGKGRRSRSSTSKPRPTSRAPRASSAASSSTTRAGCALRAGANGSSTPTWISAVTAPASSYAAEPRAAPGLQVGGLLDLGHPQAVGVEAPRVRLGTARHRDLDVVEPHAAAPGHLRDGEDRGGRAARRRTASVGTPPAAGA